MSGRSLILRWSFVLTGLAAVLVGVADHQSARGESPLQVGYGVAAADSGGRVPVSAALLSVMNPAGVLISEAGFAGVGPMRSGLLIIDQIGMRTSAIYGRSAFDAKPAAFRE